MASRPVVPALWLGVSLLASAAAAERPEDLTARWSSVPEPTLRSLWERAQGTGGVLAVEPETHVIGLGAAHKKTWDFADRVLKLVWGNSPNWFPADVMRRTVCSAAPRWSYFWHLASGDERDLHPWLDRGRGFDDLLGPYGSALVASGALDMSSCAEVGGAEQPCLYGEVTPGEPFEDWFCGGRGRTCRTRLSRDPLGVPPDLAAPAAFCVAGPWVLERVHGWRPEIHPAEVMWVREGPGRDVWRFALLADDSGRFQKAKYFVSKSSGTRLRPWSDRRPVELWVALGSEAAQPAVLDLSVRRLGKNPEPAVTAVLTPPASTTGFVRLAHPVDDVLAAIRTWTDESCACTRGVLVLRTEIRRHGADGLLIGVSARHPEAPPAPARFEAAAPPRLERFESGAEPVRPALRVLAFSRIEGSLTPGAPAIHALARFDPRRPTQPADEQEADRKNEALRGGDRDRERAFGARRPFRLVWTLEARRPDTGAAVRISVGRSTRITHGPPTDEVQVAVFPGKASEIQVKGAVVPEALDAETVVSMGRIWLRVPQGVVVTGTGDLHYVGSTDLGLPSPAARVSFRWPARSYSSEWDLLRSVLEEVQPETAAERTARLDRDACAPLAAGCTAEASSAEAAGRIADPITRWDGLVELSRPERSYARFLRLFARAILWDGRADDDERARLKRVLAAAESGIEAPPGP